MNPMLCISKSDMPQMMYELGKASSTCIGIVIAIIFFVISIFFVICAIYNKKALYVGVLFAVVNVAFGIFFLQSQANHNKTYQFNNFTYSCPEKFILQYYTVTTNKQYKFIAETEHNVFIKEIK